VPRLSVEWEDDLSEGELRAMSEPGFYWHVHHDTLLEWSRDISKRIECIKKWKPQEERETRLRLMRRVKGELPPVLVKAVRDYDKAWRDYDKARRDYDKARLDYDKAWQDYDKAVRDHDKAVRDYHKAVRDHAGVLSLLHSQECGCPWNGTTIFPEG
jgi:tetratricopeptide (TPR) repeat protein